MKEWKPSRWALWIVFSILLGVLGTWVFRHNTIGGLANLIGIGISGGVMGVVSMIRSETIRWQDSHMRRIENTIKVLDFYNEKVRELVLIFIHDFDLELAKIKATTSRPRQDPVLFRQIEDRLAIQLRLSTILHLLDKLAWLLRQTGYIERTEVLHAITSELSRFLLSERYQPVIRRMQKRSSLRNLDHLIDLLKEA